MHVAEYSLPGLDHDRTGEKILASQIEARAPHMSNEFDRLPSPRPRIADDAKQLSPNVGLSERVIRAMVATTF
jgi:hypothetical protein